MGLFIDGAIILLYFAAISAIGLYMGRRETNLKDFALGGRQIPWWAVMASIIAAETSAATFLGAPGEGFEKRSLAYVQLTIGVVLGRWVVATVFLKPYYDYKVYTVYDYLAIRFGPKTKSFVSGLFLLMRTLASGARLFIPSLVMVLAWKLFFEHGGTTVAFQQVDTVGPYIVAIIVLTIITAFYTTKGGIKAVIWTDVVQACLMFGSALIAIATLLNHIGGFEALLKAVPAMKTHEGYLVTGFEPDLVAAWQKDSGHVGAMGFLDYIKLIFTGDYTIFSALFGATMMNIAMFGTDQDMVQRMLTAETHQKAKRSLLTAAFMDIPIAAVFTFIGILLYVYYQQVPANMPKANSDIFGAYILNVMPVGIRGLVLAGVFATAMGSLSAALNALATSATNDWYVPALARRGTYTDERVMAGAKGFTVLFAVLMVLVASIFAYMKVKNPEIRIIPVVLGIAGYIVGPMLGVFLLGMFTKNRGSDKGNMIAIAVGLLTTGFLGDLHIKVLDPLGIKIAHPEWLPQISFTWFALIGSLTVFLVGVWFKTPPEVIAAAKRKRENLDTEDDQLPPSMRPETQE
ncbi:sodium:solute symporter [Armatimonas sp.]|uniref:sodium:solute symporter n=1 Tax=Armatimonas sp. TaxID=1872638 RepID=UPI00286B23EF|nr:sodium:solute symporter [Armatimonas sp.]